MLLVPGDPQKVNVVAVNSTAIRVEWKPPSEKEQFGIIRGYQIHVQELDAKVIIGVLHSLEISFLNTFFIRMLWWASRCDTT